MWGYCWVIVGVMLGRPWGSRNTVRLSMVVVQPFGLKVRAGAPSHLGYGDQVRSKLT